MGSENKRPRERWRIAAAIVSILCIVLMWMKKDLIGVYTNLPQEQLIPLGVTTVAVSLVKVAVLAGVILLAKWILGKLKK